MKKFCAMSGIAALACAGSAMAQPAGLYGYDVGGGGGGIFDLIHQIDTSVPALMPGPLVRDAANAVAGFEHGLGAYYAASTNVNTDLFAINPFTGVTTTTTMTFPAGGNVITSMDFVGSTLYGGFTSEGGGAGPSSLVTIDVNTGNVTMIGAMGIAAPTGGLTFGNGQMYTVNAGGSAATLYTVSLATGLATPVGAILDVTGAPVTLTGLEFGIDGVLYGLGRAGNQNQLFSINPASGSAAMLGTLAFPGTSSSLTTVIPAPGALAILGMGGLVALRRRR